MATATAGVLLPSEFQRNVSAPDADGALVQQDIVQPGHQSFRLGASCDSPGKTISLSVYFLNSLLQPIAVQKIQFTSGPQPDWQVTAASGTTIATGTYVGVPNYDPCWPIGGAKAIAVKADSVSGGAWTLGGMSA